MKRAATGVHLLNDLQEKEWPDELRSASSPGTVSKFIAHRARFNVLFKRGARRGQAISSGTINSRGQTEHAGMQQE